MADGITYTAEELPEGATVRAEPVGGHREGDELYYVAPGRRVIDIPGRTWPRPRPEECNNGGNVKGEWIAGLLLLCTRCGLDCT